MKIEKKGPLNWFDEPFVQWIELVADLVAQLMPFSVIFFDIWPF